MRLLLDAESVRAALAEWQPPVIVNAAASNRDEQNQEAILPAACALAEHARRAGARLIHFSTDLVFGGGAAPYDDESPLCPVWVHDLCAAVLELADGDARAVAGAMNLGGPQPISRWDFGMRLLQGLGRTAGPNVIPARMEESGLVRARDVTLRSGRAGRLLKSRLRPVDEVVSLQPGARQPAIGALATLQS